MTRKIKIKIDGRSYLVEVKDINANPIEMTVDGEEISVNLEDGDSAVIAKSAVEFKRNKSNEVLKEETSISSPGKILATPGPIKNFTAPMPGTIISIAVKVGDQVVPGDDICILEAMKMQQTLRAEWAGIVNEIHVANGDQIQGGDNILSLA